MNTIEFKVEEQTLTRVDSQQIINEEDTDYKCQFTFDEESEWLTQNKFAIFTDGWGNNSIQHLGRDKPIVTCTIPKKMLQGTYFKISIQGGHLTTTNTVSIALVQTGYTYHEHQQYIPPPLCDCEEDDTEEYDEEHPHHHHHHPPPCEKEDDTEPPQYMTTCEDYNDNEIWTLIFDNLDTIIDSITYDSKTLYLFHKDTLIESIYLPFIEETEFTGLVEEILKANLQVANNENDGLLSSEDKRKLDTIEENANYIIIDNELNENSPNAISNRTVTLALNQKEDTYDVIERIDNIIVELINRGENI